MKNILIAIIFLFVVGCSTTSLVPENLKPGDILFTDYFGKAKEVTIIENLPQHKVIKVKFIEPIYKFKGEYKEVIEYWTYQLLIHSVVK